MCVLFHVNVNTVSNKYRYIVLELEANRLFFRTFCRSCKLMGKNDITDE